ncbi:hypothetical protein NFI95_03165 [Acetobacteraceae bacterium KSS8]|uniref:Uncharacterized protein n=1 Tax=Endosaccharibacter trunci TaxID=2812733 RepID=A0ABT1W3I9_9PROT|nr:hypothetical protein [Acetobacteraceae bacterium KSS8]
MRPLPATNGISPLSLCFSGTTTSSSTLECGFVFDVLSFASPLQDDAALLRRLRMPIAVKPGDTTRFLGFGQTLHLNRMRPCGWHLAVHRDPRDKPWTHLYKVVPEGRDAVLVLLQEALEGDCARTPERFSGWPLPVGARGCEAR